MSDTFELAFWIVIIVAAIAFVIAWWWLVWICVGYFMVYFNIPGEVYMQIFLWFVVNAILGALGQVGMSAIKS